MRNRGHPLVGRCQASKRFHGGAHRIEFDVAPAAEDMGSRSAKSCLSRALFHSHEVFRCDVVVRWQG